MTDVEISEAGKKELAAERHALSQLSRRVKERSARYQLRKLELEREAKERQEK